MKMLRWISGIDITRGANVIIRQYGEDAPVHTAMRAAATLEAGDLDGYAVWKRIIRAVEELQRTAPKCPSSKNLIRKNRL